MTLTEFLLARIAEDVELVRQLITGEFAEPSRWRDDRGDILGEMSPWGSRRVALLDDGNRVSALAGEHIARWDPARVLAECEAKRRIVDEAIGYAASEPGVDYYVDADPLNDGTIWAYSITLRLLAVPYAGHPDYQETWRP